MSAPLQSCDDHRMMSWQKLASDLDVDRGAEVTVEKGEISPQGPDGPRGIPGRMGAPGPVVSEWETS
jgi:hypothetical protein